MPLSYDSFRRKLAARGLLPKSVLGRVTAYLVGVDLLLFGISRISRATGFKAGSDLGGWIGIVGFFAALLLLALALRWIRRTLMWRLRNRLIITYGFIGVIPVVLLLAMAFLASMMFTGQFAIFLATTDIDSELKAIQSANSGMAAAIAGRFRHGEPPSPEALHGFATSERLFPSRQLTVWFHGKSTVAPVGTTPVRVPPVDNDSLRTIAVDGGRLYMRALRSVPVGNDKLTVISSVPLNKELLGAIVGNLGRVTLSQTLEIDSSASPAQNKGAIQAQMAFGDTPGPVGGITAGTLPPPRNRFDSTIDFPAPFPVMYWATGKIESGLGLMVSTRRSILYQRLAASYGEHANTFIVFLIAIAIALAIVELLALTVGIRLTRTMTRSVAELYKATQHVNRGDFRHRIQVKSQDQLAALETSFNSMTESIEKLLAEQKEKQRMEHELTIAQEVQSQLFPHEVCGLRSLDVYGVCRPARTVSGDYYDFLPLGPEKLALAVGDISGKGISAALLMATIHSAVRAFSLERVPALAAASAGADPAMLSTVPFASRDGELSPAALMAMLNRQLCSSTPAEKYATLFLGMYDGRTRKLTYCNAGHLPPIILGADGTMRRLECGGTVIGLFGGITYDESIIELRPGELLLAYSDGVTEPENDFGEFGESRLIELVQENLNLPLASISESILSAVSDWIGGNEQPDDVTLVLARPR